VVIETLSVAVVFTRRQRAANVSGASIHSEPVGACWAGYRRTRSVAASQWHGAASIGEQLAKHLAVPGSNLHLSDRDERHAWPHLASGAITAAATWSPSSWSPATTCHPFVLLTGAGVRHPAAQKTTGCGRWLGHGRNLAAPRCAGLDCDAQLSSALSRRRWPVPLARA